jgi:hypothetical protein
MSMSAPLATLHIAQEARAMIDGRSESQAQGRGFRPTLKRRSERMYVRRLVALLALPNAICRWVITNMCGRRKRRICFSRETED